MGRKKNDEILSIKLKEKSIEALLLGIEIYNKPTINYRTEASAFLICNAWELILKSYRILTNGKDSIYRVSDDKSYSLEEMCHLTFADNSPIKKNLLYIVENIRNKATHFIIAKHDDLFSPLLQRAVINYSDFLNEKFNYDLTEQISVENLALFVRHNQINKKIDKIYGKDFAKHFFDDKNQLVNFIDENSDGEECSVVSIIENRLCFVKNPNVADIKAYYEEGAVPLARIYVQTSNINKTHPYTMGQIIRAIKTYFSNTSYNLDRLNCHYITEYNKTNNIYDNAEYYKEIFYGNQKYKKYSDSYLDSLITAITKHPDIFSSIKKEHPSSE